MKSLRAAKWIAPAAAAALLILPIRHASAWPGFQWETWREITGVEKPDIWNPQAGHKELLPLLYENFEPGNSIVSVEDWERKRDRIKEVLRTMLGTPSDIVVPAPKATETDREDMGEYERIHLYIASEADDRIPAYYLKPKAMDDKAQPIMIVLHQTQIPGKEEPCGMTGNPDMFFAEELVGRGIPCIVPDVIGFGERLPEGGQVYDLAHEFYRKHPNWSHFGKMSWDIARIIDYLETLPEIDATRIGVIGHSHGAYGSIMGAVFEPRIDVVVASCGFTLLRDDPKPNRWSHLTPLMPRLGFYVDDIASAPFDWHEIVACIAPRPFFNWATLDDDIFPNTGGLSDVYEQLEDVYGLYGKRACFEGRLVPGPHRFPADAHDEAYAFIERYLPRAD